MLRSKINIFPGYEFAGVLKTLEVCAQKPPIIMGKIMDSACSFVVLSQE